MDEITDPKVAALIRSGLADEKMRAKLMRDLFSPDKQVQLRALESLRDYFGEKCVSDFTLQECIRHLEKRGQSSPGGKQMQEATDGG
jgi:hypothetical protein